ncbi:MAG: hypothetical protein J6B01_10320 [Ruminococcus sp.]|nr:hypothetical protein [Ruminococcus sp.]
MDKISETKREIRLTEWQRQYEEYQKSGQTVQKWCSENNANIKTFYYRLKKYVKQHWKRQRLMK